MNRPIRFELRLSQEEMDMITDRSESIGVSAADYMRILIRSVNQLSLPLMMAALGIKEKEPVNKKPGETQ
jgi:hypothetical protein